jgi:hypothetical protein
MAHGTLMGNAVVTNNTLKLTGVSGGCANLPGGLVSGCSAVTLECWATFGANGNWPRIADFGDMSGGNGQNFLFYSPHTSSGGQMLALNSVNVAPAGTLDNRMVHVACIVDPVNSYLAVYTNGILEMQLTASLPSLSSVSSAWSFIGRSLFSSDAYLNATVDELRLYDGRLTPQQIAANDVAGPEILQVPSVNATNITFTRNGGVLTLSWPADHTGWRLQMQTNSLADTNWVDVAGSSLTNNVALPADTTPGSVFYRLVFP